MITLESLGGAGSDVFLKLDASNSPGSGNLAWAGDFDIHSGRYGYTFSVSPIKLDATTNYFITGDIAVIFSIYKGSTWYDTMCADDGTTTVVVTGLDDTVGNLDIYLIDAFDDDTAHITIVTNESWANVKAHLDSSYGTSIANDDGTEGVDAWTLSGHEYTWAGYPTGWTIADNSVSTTWITPPTAVDAPASSFSVDQATGDVTMYGDLTNADQTQEIDWEGKANFGNSGGLPLLDYVLQVAELISETAVGVISALNFFVQFQPSGASSTSVFGVYGGMQTYGSNTIQATTATYLQTRHGATGVHSTAKGIDVGFVIPSDAGARPVTNIIGHDFNMSTEGGSGTGTVTDCYGFRTPQQTAKGNWTITTLYGFYCADNTSYATTSWGVYNLDRSYLGKGVVNRARRVTTTDTADLKDEILLCQTDGGAFTQTLPAGEQGMHLRIINCGSSGNALTVDGDSSETVMGSLTQVLNDGESIDLHFDSTEGWW